MIAGTAATYCDAVIPEHKGNPLIECLPSISRDERAIAECMILRPSFSPEEKKLSKRVRICLLPKLKQLFVPLAPHQELYTRVDVAIRSSYSWRNPLAADTQAFLHHPYAAHNQPLLRCKQRAAGSIILLSGLSGIGKSFALDAIQRALGTPIVDHNYIAPSFSERQITYLTLRIPEDRSLKTAISELLLKIDLCNGGETTYYKQYCSATHCTLGDMMSGLVRALATHHTAVIFVDEVQRLVDGRSNGARDIVEFLFRMRDDCGLGVVLCGTYASLKLLHKQFRINRRLCEDGLVEIARPKDASDVQWRALVTVAMGYQWTQDHTKPSEALIGLFHELTLGIPGIFIPLLMLAQREAIDEGSERITPTLVRRTFATYFKGLAPLLAALKAEKPWAKDKWDDMFLDFKDLEEPNFGFKPPAPTPEKSSAEPRRQKLAEALSSADLGSLEAAGLVGSPL